MTEIKNLLRMLADEDHKTRRDACERLKKLQEPLSKEIVDALRLATKDPAPSVSEAAQRALAVQTSKKVIGNQPKKDDDEKIYNMPTINILVSLLGGFVTSGIMYFFFGFSKNINDFLCLGMPIAILGSFAGYWINKNNKEQAHLNALFVACVTGIVVGIVGQIGLLIILVMMGVS